MLITCPDKSCATIGLVSWKEVHGEPYIKIGILQCVKCKKVFSLYVYEEEHLHGRRPDSTGIGGAEGNSA